MSRLLSSRRSRVGAILTVLGLIAAAMAIMPAALSSQGGMLVVQQPGPGTFFSATISGTGNFDGTYPAWCVDTEHGMTPGLPYNAVVYTGGDAMPAGLIDKPQNLDLVNWVLNQGFVGQDAGGGQGNYTMCDVAQAIWALIDDGIGSACGPFTTRAGQIADLAQSHHGFVPGCGQFYLVVIGTDWRFPDGSSGERQQTLIIVLQNGPCPTGRIIVKKIALPDGAPAQSFSFDPSWGADFALSNGESADSGLLPTGVYSVAEMMPLPAGWSPTGASCDDGSSPNAIGLSGGEVVTCTFTNTYQQIDDPKGSLTIIKVATPLVAGDATLFPFLASLGDFTLADGESKVFTELDPGAYSVSETLPVSADPNSVWRLEGIECTANSFSVDEDNLSVTVNLAESEAAVCTFYNTEESVSGPTGSLTIIKQTVPAGGTGFDFDAGSLGTFGLDDDGSVTFDQLAAGAYTVAENDPGGEWAFAQVDCTALDWEQSGASVTVNLAEGEAAVCTFQNGQLPYTGPQPFMMPLLIAALWGLLAGLALMVWPWMRKADTK